MMHTGADSRYSSYLSMDEAARALHIIEGVFGRTARNYEIGF